MEIKIEEQTKQFYLAFETYWRPVVGHGIKVGEYEFCAIPTPEGINVSEVTAGLKLFTIPMSWEVEFVTSTKEGSMKYFHKIGEAIAKEISKQTNFQNLLKKARENAISKLGEMPKIEVVNTDWVFEAESDLLN